MILFCYIFFSFYCRRTFCSVLQSYSEYLKQYHNTLQFATQPLKDIFFSTRAQQLVVRRTCATLLSTYLKVLSKRVDQLDILTYRFLRKCFWVSHASAKVLRDHLEFDQNNKKKNINVKKQTKNSLFPFMVSVVCSIQLKDFFFHCNSLHYTLYSLSTKMCTLRHTLTCFRIPAAISWLQSKMIWNSFPLFISFSSGFASLVSAGSCRIFKRMLYREGAFISSCNLIRPVWKKIRWH